MQSGTISLYNQHHELIQETRYYNVTQRRNVIARWKEIENPDGYIQIDPRTPKVILIKKGIPDLVKEPIKRFPAKYDNEKSLYPELNELRATTDQF